MKIRKSNILVLAPHTDDGEIGCGGTIAKLVENGNKVYYAAFSICEESVPKKFPKNILESEVKEATRVLGIPAENLFIYKFPVRHFPKYRQELLDTIIKLRESLKPNIVFCPSSYDTHQDHATIHRETKRAFKKSTILGYEFMWNNYSIDAECFVKLNKKHMDKKYKAISKYKSQAEKIYTQKEAVYGHANYRGLQISSQYVEAFEVIRIIYD